MQIWCMAHPWMTLFLATMVILAVNNTVIGLYKMVIALKNGLKLGRNNGETEEEND